MSIGILSDLSLKNGTPKSSITPKAPLTIEYLVVGGGGCGVGGYGGGGGAGGFTSGSMVLDRSVPNTNYTVVVGAGGVSAGTVVTGQGKYSQFADIISQGGGRGGPNEFSSITGPANQGGSGGGGGAARRSNNNFGLGNALTLTPSQGNRGGNGGTQASNGSGGGGGGASVVGAAGGNSNSAIGGAGGNGIAWVDATTYAGGGGGGGFQNVTRAAGGTGGGGLGSANNGASPCTAGGDNTGGGGGGTTGTGCAGGSGIVKIRYEGSGSQALGGTITFVAGAPGHTIHSFTTVGSGSSFIVF